MKKILRWCVAAFALSISHVGYGQAYVITPSAADAGNPGGVRTSFDYTTTGGTSIWTGAQAAQSWSAVQALPFAFDFYGSPVTHYIVASNGLLSFDTTNAGQAVAAAGNTNTALPNAGLPNNTIAYFWDDFTGVTSTSDDVYAIVEGTAPNRQLWILNYSMKVGSLSYGYWAMVLEETTNNIYVMDMNYWFGGTPSSTVGVQINSTTAFQTSNSPNESFNSGGSNYTDNEYYEFNFYPAGATIPPVNVNISNVTAAAADINYDLGSSTTGEIEYGPAGFTQGSGTTVTMSGTSSTTLSGLTDNTNYDVYLRANSGGTYSTWVGPYSFWTTCLTISSYPYAESFDSLSTWSPTFNFDQCWTMNDVGSTSSFNWRVEDGPVPSSFQTGPLTDASGSGRYMHVESSYSSPALATMEMPVFDLTSLTVPELNFKYHMYGTSMGNLFVEVSTDTGSTWSRVDSIMGAQQANQSDPWMLHVVDLSAYNTAHTLIRFAATRGGTYGDVSIDEVTLAEAPPCPLPTGFVASDITSNSANVTFNAQSGATRWVEWGPAGYTQGTGITASSTTDTVALTGMAPGQCLDVYIWVDCSANSNGISGVVGPFTICTAYVPDWLEDFDGGYPPGDFYEAVGQIGSTVTYGSSNWGQDNYGNVTGGSLCAKFNIYSTFQPHHWMITPSIDLGTGNTYNLEYDVAWTEWNSTVDAIVGSDDTVHVAYSTDGGNTFDRANILYSYHSSNVVDAAGRHEVIQLSGIDGIVRIGFYTTSTVSNEDTDFFIENLEVRTPPACLEPFAFNLVWVTDSSAAITWTADSSALNSTIEWGPAGFTQGTAGSNTATAFGDSAYITGLSPNTLYDFYASVNCPASATSIISGPFAFRTACAAVFSAPYTEDFTLTSYGTADANFDFENCWSTTQTAFVQRWESEDASGANENSSNTGPHYDATTPSTAGGGYMFLEASYTGVAPELYSPTIEMSALTTPTLEFAYHMYGQDMGTLSVDVWNGSIWVEDVWSLSGEQQTAGNDPWIVAQVPLAAFVGDTIQLRFVGERNSTFYSDMSIDDVKIVNGPSCSVVSGGFATNVTSSAATLNWSAFTSSDYTIEWGVCGFSPGTGTGTTVSNVAPGYGLTGLNPNTCYEFYVVNNCDPNGTVYGPFSFLTECLAPLSGNYTVGGTAGPTNFPDLDSVQAALVCGISGPVTFDMQGMQQTATTITLNPIEGASATNTVTFTAASPSAGGVHKTGLSGPIFDIRSAKHIVISNMTLLDSGATSTYGVRLMGDADSNTISGNVFEMPNTGTSSSNAGIAVTNSETSVSGAGSDANHVVITNNSFDGGPYYCISAYGGGTTTKTSDITVSGNTVLGSTYGIRIYYYDGVNVHNNHVEGAAYAYYNYYNSNASVTGNYFSGSTYAMYTPGINFNDVATSEFVNNMFLNTGGSSTSSAVYITSSSHDWNFFHNSVSAIGYGVRDFSSSNYDMRNNIIQSGNLTIDFSVAPTSSDTMDYNLFYRTTAGNLAEFNSGYADLAALQAGQTGHNQNSVSGDPLFVAVDDLHVAGALPNDAGDNSVGVMVDFDGDVRPASGATAVDMGADEYTPLNWDAEATALYEPGAGGCGDSAVAVSMIITNLGLNTITSMGVNADVSGDVIASLTNTYTGSIAPGESDTAFIGTFNIYNGGTVSVYAMAALSTDQDNSNDTTASETFDFVSYEPSAMPGDTVCEGDNVSLYANSQSGVIHGWYENMNDTVPVATGDTLTVAADPNQTTYYLGYVTSGTDSVETTFSSNNGCGSGNMFDLTAHKTLLIDSIAVNTNTGGSVSVWIIPGTYVGNETNQSAWTLHETVTVTSAGSNTPTYVPFTNPLTLAAGTYGVYVEYDARYTNGSATYGNADMTLTLGAGLCTSWSSPINGRIWNGRIFYRAGNSCSPDKIAVSYGVTPLPVASFTATYTGGNGTGDYDFDGSASTNADSLFWDFGDGSTGNGANVSHTYAGNDTYTVTLIAFNDCGSDTLVNDTSVVVEGIGLNELSGVQNISLFPNPATAQVALNIGLAHAQDLTLEIVNLQGQVLYTENLGRVEGEYQWSGDLSELPRGVYFVRLTGDTGVKSLPLTLQ